MADELRTSLGFDASEAIATLQRIKAELDTYSAKMGDAAKATTSFNQSGSRFDKVASDLAGSLSGLASAADLAAAKLNLVAQANASAARAASAAKTGLEARAADLRLQARQAEGIMDVARSRELNAKAAELERQAALKATLQAAAQQRAAAAASQKRRDPLGLIPPSGQAQIEQTIRNMKEAEKGADNFGQAVQTAGKKGAAAGRSVLLSWESVARIFTIQLLHRGISAVSDAFADGIRDAVNYQTALAEVQTVSRDLNLTMEELDERAVNIARAFGQPLDVVTEGLYETLSNQVAQGSENFQFLATSAKFAVASVTSTNAAVNLLSSSINSFGLSATEADTVSGKLFKTIELGRIRAEEFANTYGRVAVLSRDLGVSQDELLASIAELTVTGLRYNEAFTLITNTQLKLLSPSQELRKVFDRMGIASAEAGIQAFGFQGFLQQLANQTDGTGTALGKLFNRIRAIRGVLGLTGSAAESFGDTLDQIKSASAVDLEEAFQTIFQTDATQLKRELTEIKTLFTAGFGQDALKSINAIFDAFGGGAATVKTFGLAFAAAAATYAVGASGIIAATTGVTVSLASMTAAAATATTALIAFATTPLGAALLIGGAVVATSLAFDSFAEASRKAADAVIDGNNAQLRSTIQTESLRRAELKETEDAIFGQTQRILFGLQQRFTKDAQVAFRLQESFTKSIGKQIQDRLSLVEDFIGKLNDATVDANDAIKGLDDNIKSAALSLEDFQFERQIKNLDTGRQVMAQIQRSQQLAARASQELAAGNKEASDELRKEAESAAKAALSAADSANNRALEFRATRQVQSLLQQNVQLAENEKAKRLELVELAKKQLPEAQSLLFQLKANVEELEKMELISKELTFDPQLKPEDAKKKATEYAANITSILDRLGSQIQLFEKYDPDFGPLLRKVRERFTDPRTGVRLNLENTFDLNFGTILKILKTQADAIPASQKIQLEKMFNVELGVKGFQEIQNAITQRPEDIQAAAKANLDINTNLVDQKNLYVEIDNSLNNINESLSRLSLRPFTTEATGATQTFNDLAAIIRGSLPELLKVPSLKQSEKAANDLVARIVNLSAEAERALSFETLDPQKAARNILEIQQIGLRARQSGFPELAKQIDELVKQFQSLQTSSKAGAKLRDELETLKPLEQQTKQLGEVIKQLPPELQKLGDAATSGYQKANDGSAQQQQNLRTEIQLLQERNRLQSGQSAQQRQFGGMIFRHDGGMVIDPKTVFRALGGVLGTDNILTSLTRGESVNTVAATRDFFPQIQAMNAGVTPVFRQDGGTVTNVGDVNINVTESASPRDTAREVMKQLNRELRRKTFTLGR